MLSIRLFPEQCLLQVEAEVANSGEDRTRSKNDRFFAGLSFRNLSDDNRAALLDHIALVAKQSFGGAVKLVN